MLQFVLQTYHVLYIMKHKDWLIEDDYYVLSNQISFVTWIVCILAVSAVGPHLKGRPCVYTPIYLVFMVA